MPGTIYIQMVGHGVELNVAAPESCQNVCLDCKQSQSITIEIIHINNKGNKYSHSHSP